MAIDPKRVAVQVALRTLQLTGSDQATLEASYVTANLATVMDGADVPYTALRDAVVAIEAELAEIIANDKQNPYRSLLLGRSEDLTTGEDVPVVSDGGLRFIGTFSQVNDSTDHLPLTEGSMQEITRYLRGSYTTSIRKYKLTASRFYHTRSIAYIEGCVWSRSQAVDRLVTGSTSLSPIPTSLEGTWVARCIEFLVQEGWLAAEASFYAGFAREGIALLKGRSLDLPILPTMEATSNPISN
jgi:hypothetical protein